MRFMVPTTNRSPITVMTVVDVVGVRPKGHTSFGAPVGRQIVHGDLSCFSHTAGDQIPSEFVYMFHNECHSLFIAVGYRNIAYCFSFLLQNG